MPAKGFKGFVTKFGQYYPAFEGDAIWDAQKYLASMEKITDRSIPSDIRGKVFSYAYFAAVFGNDHVLDSVLAALDLEDESYSKSALQAYIDACYVTDPCPYASLALAPYQVEERFAKEIFSKFPIALLKQMLMHVSKGYGDGKVHSQHITILFESLLAVCKTPEDREHFYECVQAVSQTSTVISNNLLACFVRGIVGDEVDSDRYSAKVAKRLDDLFSKEKCSPYGMGREEVESLPAVISKLFVTFVRDNVKVAANYCVDIRNMQLIFDNPQASNTDRFKALNVCEAVGDAAQKEYFAKCRELLISCLHECEFEEVDQVTSLIERLAILNLEKAADYAAAIAACYCDAIKSDKASHLFVMARLIDKFASIYKQAAFVYIGTKVKLGFLRQVIGACWLAETGCKLEERHLRVLVDEDFLHADFPGTCFSQSVESFRLKRLDSFLQAQKAHSSVSSAVAAAAPASSGRAASPRPGMF